jgi:hypothetical protein
MAAEHSWIISNPKGMEASLMEAGARLLVTRFLGRFISSGSLM